MITSLALLCAACSPLSPHHPAEPLTGCTVTDGDTLRCGDERVRLLAIDAPELPGHCRPGRDCAPGDPDAASAALQRAIAGRSLTIERVGLDRYGRTLAVVRAGGESLSCRLVAEGSAIYVGRWDDGGLVRRECPGIAR